MWNAVPSETPKQPHYDLPRAHLLQQSCLLGRKSQHLLCDLNLKASRRCGAISSVLLLGIVWRELNAHAISIKRDG